ncbi:MAG TPA: acetyl-CoA carboxylase biotin carboxyl carrier protein [Bacteroidia bacterium]|jgi:acetyl-CoA carboxylase biotin carboxyl carrier protein|nr:acetyl-CoA carboxylase biotin carboxyl carrier protein [Bacteroidia bacterium]
MNIKEVEELIRFVSKANVTEVELETKDIKLIIKTSRAGTETQIQAPVTVAAAPVAQVAAPVAQAAAPQAPAAAAPAASNDAKYITVKSPMIGTFYRSSGPDKPPFVNVGDKIEKGKVICIIEAMKLFNEIEAEISGTVVKVLATDASPVEYDQALLLIDPS